MCDALWDEDIEKPWCSVRDFVMNLSRAKVNDDQVKSKRKWSQKSLVLLMKTSATKTVMGYLELEEEVDSIRSLG